MARKIMARAKKHGFTLVELLIVVAIIGVLSTIGVPTFKRMVQKSKKSESKVALGGIYTSEMAFFSEYGSYGNYLKGIGFELEGSSAIYTVGFPSGACDNQGVAPVAAAAGANVQATYPTYYTDYTTATGAAAPATYAGRNAGGNCFVPGIDIVALDGADFVATATGCVAGGCSSGSGVAAAANTVVQDVWTINKARVLTNVVDGIF